MTHFAGEVAENAANPRLGGSVRIPRLRWVLHGFWGHTTGPRLFPPGPGRCWISRLRKASVSFPCERDQEHQFGLTIPVRGWSLEVND
jgi:hypothetical protein